MKKILTCVVLTLAVLGSCAIVAANVQAEGDNGFYSSIVQKLTERFNLNADEVQQVFDEARGEMQARFEERMADLPCYDELTDEQKETLSVKRDELREKFEALRDLSPEERQAKMGELREEMGAWAEEQGIDLKFIRGFPVYGFKGGLRGFGWGFRAGFFNQEK